MSLIRDQIIMTANIRNGSMQFIPPAFLWLIDKGEAQSAALGLYIQKMAQHRNLTVFGLHTLNKPHHLPAPMPP